MSQADKKSWVKKYIKYHISYSIISSLGKSTRDIGTACFYVFPISSQQINSWNVIYKHIISEINKSPLSRCHGSAFRKMLSQGILYVQSLSTNKKAMADIRY